MTTKNGNLPAMPVMMTETLVAAADSGAFKAVERISGFTKREELAARFMAAWIIHHGASGDYGYNRRQAAQDAIQDADTLLAELEATK
jgi:hypothetical protein